MYLLLEKLKLKECEKMSLIGKLWNITINVRTILVNKEVEKSERKQIALAYLRMALFKKQNKYHFLNFNVKFFNRTNFLFLFKEIFIERTYQFKAKTNNPHIVDLGSNIGLSILFFKRLYPKSTIIGFEPDKETFNLLSENISKNVNGVKLVNAAVGTHRGKINFYSSETKGWGMSTLESKSSTICKKVDVVPLSDYLNRKVDLLKMDIEGTEVEVICAAKDKLCNVDRIVLEYHFNQRNKIIPLFKALEEAGFHYYVASVPPSHLPYLNICFWGGIIVAERDNIKNEVFIEKKEAKKG